MKIRAKIIIIRIRMLKILNKNMSEKKSKNKMKQNEKK